MADRRAYVGGNWKMNLHAAEAEALAGGLIESLGGVGAADVAICPPFCYLQTVGRMLCQADSRIKLGAQDVYTQANGAFTGEVSCSMLQDVGVQVVLAGHSERRHVVGEPDTLINAKTLAALEADLEVILCIGETIEQREAGQTDAINTGQLGYGLAGVAANQMARVTIAYEPVWAIGTGKTATPDEAQEVHAMIRGLLGDMYGAEVSQATVIQYGGSVKPSNAGELLGRPDIDGALVGGAALKAADFVGIVQAGIGVRK